MTKVVLIFSGSELDASELFGTPELEDGAPELDEVEELYDGSPEVDEVKELDCATEPDATPELLDAPELNGAPVSDEDASEIDDGALELDNDVPELDGAPELADVKELDGATEPDATPELLDAPALDGVPVPDENAPELNELEVPEGVRQILSITLFKFFSIPKRSSNCVTSHLTTPSIDFVNCSTVLHAKFSGTVKTFSASLVFSPANLTVSPRV